MQWINLKNFQLPQLQYAVTTPYPWRYFALGTYATCIVVIIVLTFINVQAVGYLSLTAPGNYQTPQTSLWPPHQSYCDPHQILQGDTFRTNISIFDYVVDYVNATDSAGSGLNGLAYRADPLSTACDENYGDHRTLKLQVDALRQNVIGSVEFNCTFQSSIMAVTASNTVSYSATDDTLFGPPLLQSDGPRRVLQLLALDLAQFAQRRHWLSAAAFINCSGDDQAALEECHNSPAQLEVTEALFSYLNGSTEDAAFGSDASIENYFQALSAASLADTGIWHNNSIFVSTDIVNETLQHGSNADSVRADPSAFTLTPTPAMISMTYTCHFPQRKPLLNFFISVLVADLSIFGTFWTIFSFMAASLARSKTTSDHDVEIGSAVFDSPRDYASNNLPTVLRNSTIEFIEMGSAVGHSSGTLPIIHTGSTEGLLVGQRQE